MDEIVAVANFKRLPLQNSAWIEAVRTHPNHQNKGLASLLLRHIIVLAKEEDMGTESGNKTRIMTCTIESNKGMQRALQKVGFVRCGSIPTLSFAALKQLPGWSAECELSPQPLLKALKLEHLISREARAISESDKWRAVASEDELLVALQECKQHGGSCGYLPGLYEYIVPSSSRIDLKQSIEHGLVFTLGISDKDISGCDNANHDPIVKVILALTKDNRISSLKSQWVCSIVACNSLAFDAALAFAHLPRVAKQMNCFQSKVDVTLSYEGGYADDHDYVTGPFCLVFDGALPLDHRTLACALPLVTDECTVFTHVENDQYQSR
jgi:hypothetical protein